MRINFTVHRNPLAFCFLLVTGLLAITPATSAQEKPLKVTGIEGKLALYHRITVTVENLQDWVKQQDNDPSKFILYIDSIAFKGLPPALIDDNTKLQFDLRPTPENKDVWTTILSRRRERLHTRDVPVTVGFDNGVQVPSNGKSYPLTVVNEFWFKIFVGSFLAAIALFWYLAWKSDIIRDTGPQPEGTNRKGKPNRKPYSLARTQMAFWFFIVIISYVFIWMVSSYLTSLTPAVLGLIGISAATGLGAAVIDSSKRSEQENQRRILDEKKKSDEVETQKLNSEITALKAVVGATPPPANLADQEAALAAKQAELAAKEAETKQADLKIQELDTATKPAASKRFINDILSDDDGVSFHRFQIFAWTIVLICIFIAGIYNALSMPDFDGTLLALMGISGGTYLGFKLPEQQG
jgi:hypothetical protein